MFVPFGVEDEAETAGRDEVLSRAWVLLAPVAAPGAR